jgi:hypothetical protein
MESKNQSLYMISPLINENVALTATATNLNLSDDSDFIMRLLQRGPFWQMMSSGFANTKVQAGDSYISGNFYRLSTGGTANGSVIAYNDCQVDGDYLWNCDKVLKIYLNFVRSATDAQFVGRIQIKNVYTIGVLADHGISLNIANLTLTGEAYGAAGSQTIACGTITAQTMNTMVITFNPGVSVVFTINGTDYTLSTATKVPSTANQYYFCVSAANGAGATNTKLDITLPFFQRAA